VKKKADKKTEVKSGKGSKLLQENPGLIKGKKTTNDSLMSR